MIINFLQGHSISLYCAVFSSYQLFLPLVPFLLRTPSVLRGLLQVWLSHHSSTEHSVKHELHRSWVSPTGKYDMVNNGYGDVAIEIKNKEAWILSELCFWFCW